jgi:hypothetical protein
MPRPLRIWEVRAFPHLVRGSEWVSVDERSVAVAIRRIDISLAPKPLVEDSTMIGAAVSVHAIGRRFERGSGGSDKAVLRDLRMLSDPRAWRPKDGRRSSETELDVLTDSGWWRGSVGTLDDRPALLVRTFVPA